MIIRCRGTKNRQIEFWQRLIKMPEWPRLNTFGIIENGYVEKGYLLSYDRRAEQVAAAPAPHVAERCSVILFRDLDDDAVSKRAHLGIIATARGASSLGSGPIDLSRPL